MLTELKKKTTNRYEVRLVKFENSSYGTFYKIHTHRIGRNGRWYNSGRYAHTILTALQVYNRAVDRAIVNTTW